MESQEKLITHDITFQRYITQAHTWNAEYAQTRKREILSGENARTGGTGMHLLSILKTKMRVCSRGVVSKRHLQRREVIHFRINRSASDNVHVRIHIQDENSWLEMKEDHISLSDPATNPAKKLSYFNNMLSALHILIPTRNAKFCKSSNKRNTFEKIHA